MTKRRGFVPPENASISDDTCVLVFLPDDPYAIAAFFGQYEDLGLWTSWLQTGNSRAVDIAQRYKQSINETLELYREVGCMSPLTINVNCGSSGACCGQFLVFNVSGDVHLLPADYDGINLLPGGQVDDGVNPPSPDWTTYTEYQQYKCNVSQRFAEDLLATLDNIAEAYSGFIGWSFDMIVQVVNTAFVSRLIEGLIAAIFQNSGYVERFISATLNLADTDPIVFATFSDVVALLTLQDIKCAIYNAQSAADANANLRALWTTAMDSAGIASAEGFGTTRTEFTAIFNLCVHYVNLEPAFDLTGVSETFGGADCSMCSGVTPVTGNLISHLKLESGAGKNYDEVTQTYWTMTGTVGTVAGPVGDAGSFSAANYLSSIVADQIGAATLEQGSVSCWVRIASKSNYWPVVIFGQSIGDFTKWSIWIEQTSGQIYCGFGVPGADKSLLSGVNMALDTWYHIVIRWRYDAGAGVDFADIWINGAQAGSTTLGSVLASYESTTQPVYVGREPYYSSPFAGDVDEVRIYDAMIAESVVLALFNEGTP